VWHLLYSLEEKFWQHKMLNEAVVFEGSEQRILQNGMIAF
jgi:hypothetical protein